MKDLIRDEFQEHIALAQKTMVALSDEIQQAAEICLQAIRSKNKIFFFGNGGSAADAEHLAAEFTGRYQMSRRGLPAISLTSDSAALTSISNDFGFEMVFSRQIEALAQKGDVCIGISTSGKSINVNRGLEKGKIIGCRTIGLTGRDGGDLIEYTNVAIIVPSEVTSRIQEMHIVIGHILCHIIETQLEAEEQA